MSRAHWLAMGPILMLWVMAALTPCEPQSGGYRVALTTITLVQLVPALSMSAAVRLPSFQALPDWLSL